MAGDVTLPPTPPARLPAERMMATADRGPVPRPAPPAGRADLPAEQTVQPGAAARGAVVTDGFRTAGGTGPELVGITLYQDADSRRYVAVIRDKSTGEVIEQIPTDRLLELYATLRERFLRIGVEIEV